MSAPRDVSPCFDADDKCRICGQPRTPEGFEHHTAHHLADGLAVVQRDFAKGTYRVLPTASVPTVDAQGFSVFESDGDTWDNNSPNAQALRAAHLKAKVLGRELKRKLRAAVREAK